MYGFIFRPRISGAGPRDLDVTNIYGSDPDLTDADMSSGLNGNRGSGDGNSYPQMKSVSLGLSVTF